MSKIEWTDATWNPVTGCTKISTGCKNCYAERMTRRLQAMGQPKYINGLEVRVHEDVLEYPLKWKKPRLIFVNSMSDLFHKDISDEFIKKVFDVMKRAHWHEFQILTKRSNRLEELDSELTWAPNIWMGVTVECDRYLSRVDSLRKSGARIKFLSLEPLLGPLNDLNLDGIDWVIVGGETGHRARYMDTKWVHEIRDKCFNKSIPFFFKQWGSANKKKGRLLDGVIYNQYPETEEL